MATDRRVTPTASLLKSAPRTPRPESVDIVLVDQRGTGGSHALERPLPTGATDTPARLQAYVRSCLASLDGDAAQYGTRAIEPPPFSLR